MDRVKFKSIFKIAIFGILIEFVILAILFLIFSIVVLYSNISISMVDKIPIIIGAIGLFLTTFITSRIVNKKGFLIGLVFGFATSLLIFVLTFFTTNVLFSINELTKAIIVTISSCLGGVFGVNSKN